RSGKQWSGEKFIHGTAKSFSFPLRDVINSVDIWVRVNAASRSPVASEMLVSANQSGLGKIGFGRVNTSDVTALFADERESRFSLTAPVGDLSLTLKYSGNTVNAEAWLDFIEINYRRKLKLFNKEVLFFRDIGSADT
ncbi:MAG: hypothetical protein H8D67_24745, partial [Deltaproteobacteria bacterium]|nr:hypothetical protein [Deltaproteobacteria bacterium]